MLTIVIPAGYKIDDDDNIISWPEVTVNLEHSLASISKWEAKYRRPYLKPDDKKTALEVLDYIKMMSLTDGVTDDQWNGLSHGNVEAIKEYISENQTATTFSDKAKKAKSREIITSELIYCWMVQQQIPFECQYWHLSRLLTLINVVSIKNQPPEKQNPIDSINRTRELNKARRAANVKTPHIPKH